MRRRLLLSLAVVLALVAGLGFALLTTRSVPSGTLETDVTDVTVVTPTAPPVTTAPTPKPPKPEPKPDVDVRCWPMFGGDARRTLARPAVELGLPKRKPLWARGSGSTSSTRRATATASST